MGDRRKREKHLLKPENDLEIIYSKYYDLLLNYGLKFYPDADLVKDCIQDLFVKLYIKKFNWANIQVRAYLLKSIRNILIDKLAKQKLLVSENDISFHMPVDEDGLEKEFGGTDDELLVLKKLLHSFGLLPDKQKQILYFRYVKDLSHKEIAEILDINEQSSMNLASRALTKLRKLVQDNKVQTFAHDETLKKGLVLLCMVVK